jgi:hypothetical protein
VRHFEAALAILLWLVLLPAMLYLRSNIINCVIVALVIGLMLHAYSLRPYCVEFDDEEEEAMIMMSHPPSMMSNPVEHMNPGQSSRGVFDMSNKDTKEEWRLIGFVLLLLSTVGSSIAFSMGGSEALCSWLAPTASDCSIADLRRLQSNHSRFHCRDGFVDLSQRRSLLTKGGTMLKTYTEHRIAPIYLQQPEQQDIPVAWAVSKNLELSAEPCGKTGLCGLFASAASASSDKASFDKLKRILHNDLVEAGASRAFEEDSIPTVVLTNLADPEGKAVYSYVGLLFHLFVLFGLCNVQWLMFCEPESKIDASWSACGRCGNPESYDQLLEGIEQSECSEPH